MNKNKRTRSNLDIVYTILDFARLILITVVAAMWHARRKSEAPPCIPRWWKVSR